jgi:hypothetical protein
MDDEQDCKEHGFPKGREKIEIGNIANTLFHKALRISRCFERVTAVEGFVEECSQEQDAWSVCPSL